jgi:hypothetical protein
VKDPGRVIVVDFGRRPASGVAARRWLRRALVGALGVLCLLLVEPPYGVPFALLLLAAEAWRQRDAEASAADLTPARARRRRSAR